ncbi:hypothetical protein K2173_008086 [Erythroxylum novogranatense]|uniref:Auxin-responsive protein n=1 Tax=Erythroxylum novogranatense TaxID=1862640 RepID=A0AAV8S8W9_9ROSI|nr:hypothetical protein K2173_008086 [Erythroxylum novogranatense]
MGGGAASSSSSSLESSNCPSSSTNSSFSHLKRDLSTDLRLGLSISACQQEDPSMPSGQPLDWPPINPFLRQALAAEETECNSATFFVKVYMEGIPIGRKLNLLAHDNYYDLIRTLDNMFNTTILWADMEGEQTDRCHVLTYEDKEGDWLMVGDVPWEMFLSSVRRLKITTVTSD